MSQQQTEATVQADWILPPNVGLVGAGGSAVFLNNACALAMAPAAVTIDMNSIPSPTNLKDPSMNARNSGPLGHYTCFQAQGADAYIIFGPSVASMTTGQVAAIPLTAAGSGYVNAPTIAITGGGGSGATATATIDTTTGLISNIAITAAGSGYTSAPTVAFSGGSYTGASATAVSVLGTTPSASTYNTVAASGSISIVASTMAWIPQGQTASFKLPSGSPEQPWGTNSPWRYCTFLTASGSGALRVWQSSP